MEEGRLTECENVIREVIGQQNEIIETLKGGRLSDARNNDLRDQLKQLRAREQRLREEKLILLRMEERKARSSQEKDDSEGPPPTKKRRVDDEVVKFWKKLQEINIDEYGVLKLGDAYILGSKNLKSQIFVRDCYGPLLKECNKYYEDRTAIVLVGTPGIGKTFFGFYFLWWAAQNKKTVYYVQEKRCFVFSVDGAWTLTDNELSKVPISCWEDDDTYLIMDAIKPTAAMEGACRGLLITSPRRDVYFNYHKQTKGVRYVMPLWDECEMKRYAQCCLVGIDEGMVKEFYGVAGGAVRYLSDIETVKRNMKIAVQNSKLYSVERLLESEGGLEDPVSHRLFHIDLEKTSDDECKVILKIASPYAEDIIVEHYRESAIAEIETWLLSTNATTCELRGRLFEHYAHAAICDGGAYRWRKLGKSGEIHKEMTWEPGWEKHDFKHMESVGKPEGGYYICPHNYSTFDAYSKDYFFQMTISNTHEIQAKALINMCRQDNGMKKAKFVFVVPNANFEQWTKRQPLVGASFKYLEKIEQFVVGIPVVGRRYRSSDEL